MISRFLRSLKSDPSEHPPEFTQARVHFTYMRFTKRTLDLELFSRRLLDSDVAVAVAWPSEEGVRVPPRTAALMKQHDKWGKVADDFKALGADGSIWRFAMRHPVVVLRGMWARNSGGSNDDTPENHDTVTSSLDDSLALARDVVARQQAVSVLEREFDRDLFRRQPRFGDEYVRVVLRNVYVDLQTGESGNRPVHVVIEPRLLLHESGAVQLSLNLHDEEALSTGDIIALADPNNPQISSSQLSEAFLLGTGLPRTKWHGKPAGTADSGSPLWGFEFSEGGSVLELADFLAMSVLAIGRAKSDGKWFCYVTSLINPKRCCVSERDWRSNHSRDLAKLITKFGGDAADIKPTESFPDFSIRSKSSLHLTLGSALYIDWTDRLQAAIRDLYTVLVVEHALLLYWRLAQLQDRVTSPLLSPRKLRRLQLGALDLFGELDQRSVRYGTARDISRHVLSEMGSREMRATTEGALALQAEALATRKSGRDARRANLIAVFGVVIALLVAVPSISAFLALAARTPKWPGWDALLSPMRWLHGLGAEGVWVVVGWLLAATAVAWALPGITRVIRIAMRIRFRRRGAMWSGAGIEYRIDDVDTRGSSNEGDALK